MTETPVALPEPSDHEIAAQLAAQVERALDASSDTMSVELHVQLATARAMLAVFYELRAVRTGLADADRARHSDIERVMDELHAVEQRVERIP